MTEFYEGQRIRIPSGPNCGTVEARIFDDFYVPGGLIAAYRVRWDNGMRGVYRNSLLIPVCTRPTNYGEEDD